ncbi:MAG: ribonuclease H family protein [Patescibacteria group bacterium]|nr:viroplasmin family protein [Patescibacteria group bacterium]MDE2015807.1 ribonuclease H family protein [Patescibacteria group bacterium]MDE2227182.1 ribonuclease H family protein [Patescibacteria group bacterium]
MTKNKFYAYIVPRGKIKGIASNWTECEKLVKGQIGARYRGFTTREEAEKWLDLGARYEVKAVVKPTKGIYFDAGTGRGQGVEISVTNERGKSLLHKIISKKNLNRFGKHLVGPEVTNNYGELLACKYALQLARKSKIKKIFGDSSLIIDYWTKWRIKKDVAPETFALARETASLREKFEEGGGEVHRISGNDNPADLGFHK